MAENKNILLDIKEHIATITLNRPDKLNAFTSEVMEELKQTINNIKKNQNIYCVIITGNGKSFCAGGDIAWEKSIGELENNETMKKLNEIQKIFHSIEEMPQPVIAAINGYAIGGGCELAMACDIRIAVDSAIFSHPETCLATVAPLGGTQRLPRLIGLGKAKYMLFSGEKIDAKTALSWGLVDFCVSKDEFSEFVDKISHNILKGDFFANAYTKKMVNREYMKDMIDKEELLGYAMCSKRKENSKRLNRFLKK